MPSSAQNLALAKLIRQAVIDDGVLAAEDFAVVISNRRKNIVITTDISGRHTVRVRPPIAPQRVVDFVRNKAAELERNAIKLAAMAPRHPVKHLVDGEEFTWLGQTMRLHLTEQAGPARRVRHDSGWQLVVSAADVRDRGAGVLTDWYCREGLAWVERNAPSWWRRIAPGSRAQPGLDVRDLGKVRAGVFNGRADQVAFHWPLFQLPAALCEYVLVHELAHATRPPGKPHGPEFWACVKRVMPDGRRRQRLMRQAWLDIWTGATR
ncbi:YgjP-like metallopeptidase domain-containing protein [Streptomyces aureoversilis]|uniref:YgjP-like metallopeptidase domain-containing protein n=1 Tax=Streptomyces aureoversilis TaxID=67277 RepID=A0ABW0A5K6_9ACTN